MSIKWKVNKVGGLQYNYTQRCHSLPTVWSTVMSKIVSIVLRDTGREHVNNVQTTARQWMVAQFNALPVIIITQLNSDQWGLLIEFVACLRPQIINSPWQMPSKSRITIARSQFNYAEHYHCYRDSTFIYILWCNCITVWYNVCSV